MIVALGALERTHRTPEDQSLKKLDLQVAGLWNPCEDETSAPVKVLLSLRGRAVEKASPHHFERDFGDFDFRQMLCELARGLVVQEHVVEVI
jgi:hypothetical protein